MATIKFRRGVFASIPTLAIGEPGWASDTQDLYMGTGSGNIKFFKATDHTKAIHDALGILHSSLGGKTANDHHAQSHTLASHSTKPHSALTDIGIDNHHAKVHGLVGAAHFAAGLTIGHVVRASGSATFAWAQLQHSDLGGVTSGLHHAQLHETSHRSGAADQLHHDYLAGFLAAEHKSLPNTIALVLSNHTLSLHSTLGLMPKTGGTFSGVVYARDHGSASVDEIVNVCYGAGSPPTANTTTIGTIWFKYV